MVMTLESAVEPKDSLRGIVTRIEPGGFWVTSPNGQKSFVREDSTSPASRYSFQRKGWKGNLIYPGLDELADLLLRNTLTFDYEYTPDKSPIAVAAYRPFPETMTVIMNAEHLVEDSDDIIESLAAHIYANIYPGNHDMSVDTTVEDYKRVQVLAQSKTGPSLDLFLARDALIMKELAKAEARKAGILNCYFHPADIPHLDGGDYLQDFRISLNQAGTRDQWPYLVGIHGPDVYDLCKLAGQVWFHPVSLAEIAEQLGIDASADTASKTGATYAAWLNEVSRRSSAGLLEAANQAVNDVILTQKVQKNTLKMMLSTSILGNTDLIGIARDGIYSIDPWKSAKRANGHEFFVPSNPASYSRRNVSRLEQEIDGDASTEAILENVRRFAGSARHSLKSKEIIYGDTSLITLSGLPYEGFVREVFCDNSLKKEALDHLVHEAAEGSGLQSVLADRVIYQLAQPLHVLRWVCELNGVRLDADGTFSRDGKHVDEIYAHMSRKEGRRWQNFLHKAGNYEFREQYEAEFGVSLQEVASRYSSLVNDARFTHPCYMRDKPGVAYVTRDFMVADDSDAGNKLRGDSFYRVVSEGRAMYRTGKYAYMFHGGRMSAVGQGSRKYRKEMKESLLQRGALEIIAVLLDTGNIGPDDLLPELEAAFDVVGGWFSEPGVYAYYQGKGASQDAYQEKLPEGLAAYQDSGLVLSVVCGGQSVPISYEQYLALPPDVRDGLKVDKTIAVQELGDSFSKLLDKAVCPVYMDRN